MGFGLACLDAQRGVGALRARGALCGGVRGVGEVLGVLRWHGMGVGAASGRGAP